MRSLLRILQNPEKLVCYVRSFMALLYLLLIFIWFGWQVQLLLATLLWGLLSVPCLLVRRHFSLRLLALGLVASDLLLATLYAFEIRVLHVDLSIFYFWGVTEACVLLGWGAGMIATLLAVILHYGMMLYTPEVTAVEKAVRLLFFIAETFPLFYLTYMVQVRRRQSIEKSHMIREKELRIHELEAIARDLSHYTFTVQDRAVLDQLTQLYNQTDFHNRLMVEVEKARQQGTFVSLVLFDIDNFKSFNDTYGHQCGDEVLRTVAKVISDSTKDSDFIAARIGGEELAVIIPALSHEEAMNFAQQVCQKIAQTTVVYKEVPHLHVTVSGGVATFPTHAEDGRTLTRSADLAMYAAKSRGKNCVISFETIKLMV